MDKHVIDTSPLPACAEEQLDWVHLLEPTQKNPETKVVAPLIIGPTCAGKTRPEVAGVLIAGGARHE